MTSDGFCSYCTNFAVRMVGGRVECSTCGAIWSSRSYYWTALDEWEGTHKKKIDDVKAERERVKQSYIDNGGLEKDLAVLVANTRLDMSNQMAKKILDILEDTGKSDPSATLNRVAIALGGFVGDAIRDLDKAEKEMKDV